MRKVMLVEDEELIILGLQNILEWEKLGMKIVHTACNGREALKLLEEEPVDIIVADINMPVMDGLSFLRELRKTDNRSRCIILTGYNEFEYARQAVPLEVEDYILKPINEEKLEEVLKLSDQKLTEFDRKEANGREQKAGWAAFVRGELSQAEGMEYMEFLTEGRKEEYIYPVFVKLNVRSMKEYQISDVLLELKKEDSMKVVYLSPSEILLFLYTKEAESQVERYLEEVQNKMESTLGILSFISVGKGVQKREDLEAACKKAWSLQKYQLLEGYGSVLLETQMEKRRSQDILVDENLLRKMILQKNREEAFCYIEDLFIHNVEKEMTPEDLYQMALKIAMLLQDMKTEYHLKGRADILTLTELIEKIYRAEDLLGLKAAFAKEVAEIIAYLHENDSQYTPVVKQIIAEVQKNYRDDMNLKTLSYKYHMNASYLGQIFQKEVGCSFAQYLSNTKNGVAKDLILNTNMRINDIAREVGYPDTSYFYRKFKQCFGVSPASLREMKKY